jgi:hypothetical protein
LYDFANPFPSATMTPVRVAFGIPRRDDPCAILLVIKRDHPIVHPHRQIRHREFLPLRSWQSLEVMAQIVAEQSRDAALKRWQLRQRIQAKVSERLFQREQWIDSRFPRDMHAHRIGSEKRVSPQLAFERAIQEQKVRTLRDSSRNVPHPRRRR